MECEWLILCRDVQKHPDGGQSLMGVFGRLAADEIPVSADPVVAAFRLRGEPNERFEVQVELQNSEGHSLRGSDVLAHRIPGYGVWDSHVTLSPLTLPTFGTYRVVLRLNHAIVKTTLLQLEKIVH